MNQFTAENYEEMLIAKTNEVTNSNKKVQKLAKLQEDFVNAMEMKKERNSRKRPAEDCLNGCRNPRFGCDTCKLSDIGKRLKLAEEIHQSKIDALEHFARNARIAPASVPVNVNEENVNEENDNEEVKSEDATPPIVLIPLHQPKSEPSDDSTEAMDTDNSTTTDSSNSNEGNTSYDDMVQRNLGQESDNSLDTESDIALDTSFEMWMPRIETSDADETADADADNADATATEDANRRLCYCCVDLDFCLNEF